ncbi:MAG: SAM-dependent chlorinase/fluorinase [Anaerolineae bacterium]|nr:SAM-dependent chlorinase/fluorinase [Anaerolineae bacterium]
MRLMISTTPIITLLTDFGERDGYVGTMKGVIVGIVPHARLIDISHQVDPQDVRQAASILAEAYAYFPAHTVHLVVVDPGVGSDRRPVALKTPGGTFVAPDNGVLTLVRRREPAASACVLNNPDYWLPEPSRTFHGRDIFSPVAAHLASGVPLDELGTPVTDLVELPLAEPVIASGSIRGEVFRIDHFGNILTNITDLRWVDDHTAACYPTGLGSDPGEPVYFDARSARVTCGPHTINGLSQTYSQVSIGQVLSLIGSSGELEISINQGNAQEKLRVGVGDLVTIYFKS